MKFVPHIALVLAAVFSVAADKKSEQTQKPVPSAAQIQKWVKQLGDESFKLREEATRDLIKSGSPVFKAVADAAKSNDPEVRGRANRILEIALKKLKAKIKRDKNGRVTSISFQNRKKFTGNEWLLLRGFPNLTELDLSYIQVKDISPLKGLTNLKKLKLDRTQFSKEEVQKLQKALPDCEVIHLRHPLTDVAQPKAEESPFEPEEGFGFGGFGGGPSPLQDELRRRQINIDRIRSDVFNEIKLAREKITSDPKGVEEQMKVVRDIVRSAPELPPAIRSQLAARVEAVLRRARKNRLALEQRLRQEAVARAAARERLRLGIADERKSQPRPSPAQIQKWIKQLGDDDFKLREKATRDLIKAGEVAFDAVAKARKSEDAEVRQRALRIIKQFEKEAIAYFKKLNGRVTVDLRSPGRPIKQLSLSSTKVTDVDLVYLQGLTSLQKLYLSKTNITDAGLVHLKGLANLHELYLSNTNITDAGLVHLKGLTNLRELYLSETKITGTGLVHLKGLTSLQRLHLASTKLTDAGLVHLQGLTGLRMLWLYDTKVADAGLVHLKGLTELHWLALGSNGTDAGLVHLKGLTNLRLLWLRNTKVTEAGIEKLKKALPKTDIKHDDFKKATQ